ncbi:hypothetical protein FRC10_008858 [Ceratobasidium sp. 414]|nr:hypothetical protein FRC10_008858 [Ceratobasidium sp. 414]
MDAEVQIRMPLDIPAEDTLLSQPVFPLIHAIKQDIENALDVNYSVFRPILFKYAKLRNYSIILAAASYDLAFAPLKRARADACEILAMKLLRRFTAVSDNPIDLFSVLTVGWDPLQGCPESCLADIKDVVGEDLGNKERTSALELAISSGAKRFIASPLVQNCVSDIYAGRVVFSAPAARGSLLADNYKQRHASARPSVLLWWTKHELGSRLRVPRYRAHLEFTNFAILLFVFVLFLNNKNFEYMVWSEIVFIIFAFGFLLDELTAAQEHGWAIYMQNMWNGFDIAFGTIFLVFLGCRCRGLVLQDFWWNDLAFDILACGACVLFPRLAFFAIKNNIIILALQGMIAEFFVFIMLAAVCQLNYENRFGNTYLSFSMAESFHPVFGPILMVTILISILSNTFARINEHASEEYLYQYSIQTIEGVKSDALFSYQPPFNILALLFLYPLSTCLSPRHLHTVNVLLIRITSFPQLLIIGVYERFFAPDSKYITTSKGTSSSIFDSLPRHFKFVETFVGSSKDDVMDAIFEVDVPPNVTSVFESDEQPGMEDSTVLGKSKDPERNGDEREGRPRLQQLSPTPRRDRSQASKTGALEAPPSSPLAKLFGSVRQRAISAQGDALGDIKRITEAMESLKEAALPGEKLRQEIKELSERQTRIETLLLTLTRGMRGEGSGSSRA